jgi:hypothetical protein|tara:strand:+ start:67 stop:417 length:351 start_codon:yes stop_codon:yes gene_type:complete
MTISRYNKRETMKNTAFDYAYSDIFRNRGLRSPRQYTIANFKYPTTEEIEGLQLETKIWSIGEKYFKLAYEYYGDPEYWWVIAWYNQKPLETDFSPGEVVEIPLPLELILQHLDVY